MHEDTCTRRSFTTWSVLSLLICVLGVGDGRLSGSFSVTMLYMLEPAELQMHNALELVACSGNPDLLLQPAACSFNQPGSETFS
jgi:hypothetical protein